MPVSSPVRIVTRHPSDPVRIEGPLPSYPNTVTVGNNLSDYTTIQAAIDSITDAAETNPYQVNIAPGNYVEDLTTKAYVHLRAPAARIVGNHTVGDNAFIKAHELTADSGTIVTKTGTGLSTIDIDRLTVPDGGIGAVNQTATSILFLLCRLVQVGANAIGLGDGTTGFGHTHLSIQDLYLAGDNCIGVAGLGTRSIVGFIDHILELGTPTGTTGISVFANGIVRLNINEIVCDTAYNVVATGTLDLIVGRITGTRTQAGGATVRENGMPTTNPGAGLVWSNNGVPTVGS